jgi:hypothetical protein
MILPAGGHDRMRCFTDQVKLTCALVQNLDEAVKEVKLLPLCLRVAGKRRKMFCLPLSASGPPLQPIR